MTTDAPLPYELGLEETAAGTGYFKAVPQHSMTPAEMLAYLIQHPNDGFFRHHMIDLVVSEHSTLGDAIQHKKDHPAIIALLHEAAILSRNSDAAFTPEPPTEAWMEGQSPLIYLKAEGRDHQALHRRWIDLFRRNIDEHTPLPHPEESALPWPVAESAVSEANRVSISLNTMADRFSDASPLPRIPSIETAVTALERLADAGVVALEEQRHEASLSPVALLRQWRLDRSVRNGGLHYRLQGLQTAYGRGLNVDDARAAYAMEMVERVSAFADIDGDRAVGYRRAHRLRRGRFTDLTGNDVPPLNPDALVLEVPYENAPLYWIEGRKRTLDGETPVLVPAQCVFLFCNLDEAKLFSGLGSTGLASGNTMAEAKTVAILEVIERDSEAVTPFDPARCFTIETTDERLNRLLQSYAGQGIFLQFQDLTQPMGVPCCKCHVIHPSGGIVKGTGAHLSAHRALLSALTETPYPFPNGPASLMPMHSGMRVPLEKLPDYSTGNAETDLERLESLLLLNGLTPIYIDLTREDLNLPVVRVLIPGMDTLGDFSPFSRVHPRLFANYISMFNVKGPSPAGS